MIESIFFNPWMWITPIFIVILGVALIWGIFALGMGDDDYIPGGAFATVFGGLGLLGLSVAYFGYMLPPYDSSFYQTYRITGTVNSIEAALSGGDGTMSQVFIAQVDGIDLYIKSDDQRFRTINAGDSVNLVCTKGFDYFQEPWFNCSIGGK